VSTDERLAQLRDSPELDIPADVIEWAHQLVKALRGPVGEPRIYPCGTDGVQLEWERDSIDVEVEVNPAGASFFLQVGSMLERNILLQKIVDRAREADDG